MGVQVPSEPITRKEAYLAKAAGQAVEIPAEPITREEAYLDAIAKGGGGGGTTNYNSLSNKPQIAGTTLTGNKSLADLGIASAEDVKVKDVKVDNASCVDENGNAVVVIKKPLTGKVYKFSTPSMEYTRVQTYRDNELLSTVDYWYRDVYRNPVTVDDVFTLTYPNSTNWYVTLLIDVIDHSAGDVFYWAFGATPSISELDCIASILDVELSAAYAELNNAIKYNEDAIDTIKDGQNINSFAGVETALGNKQDALTFDNVPTENSTNPVKSGGVHSALAGKQDAYETITYAQWQAMTPAQQAAKDYYISDYPSSQITAGNVSYNNSSSGMSADDVQEAVDELKSGLTNLQTVTITASEGVTISDASIKRVGKVIIGYATIELASDVATYGVVATLSVNVASKVMYPTNSGKLFYTAENDNKVRVWRQTSAAAYIVQFVAFAND